MDASTHDKGNTGLEGQVDDLGIADWNGPDEGSEQAERLGSELLNRCNLLLSELEDFQDYLVKHKRDRGVEMRHFKNSVKAECRSLAKQVSIMKNETQKYLLNNEQSERDCRLTTNSLTDSVEILTSDKLSTLGSEVERSAHALRSSNFPFYEAVWDIAKTCTGVIAFDKRFYWSPARRPDCDASRNSAGDGRRRCSAWVDIVAMNGLEWVKISTLTERRLLFDMAKAGWAGESSSDDESSEDDEPDGLLKQAEALAKASRAVRVRYHHPKVRIVLPKIKRGGTNEVASLIHQIKALGISVQTTEDLQEVHPISAVLKSMAVDPFAALSTILNIDCTILLAFVSDLSHGHLEEQRWYHRSLLRQIEMEKDDQLLPNSLWPACGSKRMVCTKEAARRMREIVDLIGTDSEKRRTDCLIQTNISEEWPQKQRIHAFQELSRYKVPAQWNLPIEIVDADLLSIKSRLPPVSIAVLEHLTPINQSVFLYGWDSRQTTISSNKTVAKEIELAIEQRRLAEDDEGPDIWLCPTARSLIGKEKARRN